MTASWPVLVPVPLLDGQSSHVSDVCASDALYLPATQAVQSARSLAVSLNVPATQADTLVPLPVYPAFARQSVKAALPVLVPVPVLLGHGVQSAALLASALYDPAGHAATSAPLPVYPASARQSVKAALPVLVPVPVLLGHGVQAASLFADALYVPGRQADTLPPLRVYPASARQDDCACEAPGLLLLSGQASQAALDIVDDLYVPGKHGDTLVPLPVYPASARQALTAAECAGLCEWAGQATHTLPSPW